MYNIESRIIEIKKKVEELDNLIDDTLNNEPQEACGTYGNAILKLFKDTAWLDVCIGK